MIEKRIKNGLTLKRYRLFKKQKRSVLSLWILLIVSFFSFTGEFWSNSKPILMWHEHKLYFPVLVDYHPREFKILDTLEMNYRRFEKRHPESVLIWPFLTWDPFESNQEVSSYPSPPTLQNLFGTDDRGRDILARLLYGFRYSISYALLVWFLSVVVAVIFGGIMGYVGGWVDLLGQRGVEVLSTVPTLFLLIILVSIFEPSLWWLIVITSFFGWIGMSYYVRGEFLKNRKQDYVEAAKAMGASHFRLIFLHILPNSLVPIVTFSPFIISTHITGLAMLDYLGFGLNPPTPSWGELLNQAMGHFTTAWWLAVFPSFALFFTLVLMAFVGDGVRVAFDPKRAS